MLGAIRNAAIRRSAIEAVRESEEKYRIAAEQTGQIVIDYDLKSNLIDWAGAIKELTGYDPREYYYMGVREWRSHVHPEDRKRVLKTVFRAIKKGERFTVEYRIRRKDGSYFFVEDRGTCLLDKNGHPVRVIAVMKDVTERKLASEILKESEERYRIITEQTGQLVYDYNLNLGKVSWAGAIEEVTGYPPEEFRSIFGNADNSSWLKNIHEDDREKLLEEAEKHTLNGSNFRVEYRFRKKDGSYIYVEDSGICLRDEKDLVNRVLGVMKDITEQKRSIWKLKESEENLQKYLKNFRGIGVQFKGEKLSGEEWCREERSKEERARGERPGEEWLIPLFLHGAVEELTGYKEEDFLSGEIDWIDIIEPEDLPELLRRIQKLKNKPNSVLEHEYRIKRRDGRFRWIHLILENIPCKDSEELYQGFGYDVTERKVAEEALIRNEKIRQKEIHHRIKNNLQVISSLLDLEAEKFSDEKVIEAFAESRNRITSISLIHEELHESGNSGALDFTVYLKKLAEELFRSCRIGSKEISLQMEVKENVFFDMDTAIPLGIIINELVSNAFKYAFAGRKHGTIQIKLQREEKAEHHVNWSLESGERYQKKGINKLGERKKSDFESAGFILTVSDDGKGMPENMDIENLPSLGLQLVRILVDQLEGEMSIKNDKGTEFEIRFQGKYETERVKVKE